MDEQTGIAGGVLARLPGLVAEFVFKNEMVIAVGLLRDNRPEAVAGDVQHAVGHAEDFERVFEFRVLQPGVAVAQRLAVESVIGPSVGVTAPSAAEAVSCFIAKAKPESMHAAKQYVRKARRGPATNSHQYSNIVYHCHG